MKILEIYKKYFKDSIVRRWILIILSIGIIYFLSFFIVERFVIYSDKPQDWGKFIASIATSPVEDKIFFSVTNDKTNSHLTSLYCFTANMNSRLLYRQYHEDIRDISFRPDGNLILLLLYKKGIICDLKKNKDEEICLLTDEELNLLSKEKNKYKLIISFSPKWNPSYNKILLSRSSLDTYRDSLWIFDIEKKYFKRITHPNIWILPFSYDWVNKERIMYIEYKQGIIETNIKSGRSEVVIDIPRILSFDYNRLRKLLVTIDRPERDKNFIARIFRREDNRYIQKMLIEIEGEYLPEVEISPSGEKLAVLKKGNLFIYNLFQSSPTQLTKSQDICSFVWLSNEKFIVYATLDSEWIPRKLYIINMETKKKRRIYPTFLDYFRK